MTSPRGWTRDLVEGLAAFIADNTTATWRPTGSYLSSETAISISVRPATPSRLIAISPYVVSHVGPAGDETVGIQTWFRARPGDVLDLADEVHELINGAGPLQLGGIWVSQIWRKSGDDLGADQGTNASGLAERVHNYYALASRPSPNYE